MDSTGTRLGLDWDSIVSRRGVLCACIDDGNACVQTMNTISLKCRMQLLFSTTVDRTDTQRMCPGTVDGQYYAPLVRVHPYPTPRTPGLTLLDTLPTWQLLRT